MFLQFSCVVHDTVVTLCVLYARHSRHQLVLGNNDRIDERMHQWIALTELTYISKSHTIADLLFKDSWLPREIQPLEYRHRLVTWWGLQNKRWSVVVSVAVQCKAAATARSNEKYDCEHQCEAVFCVTYDLKSLLKEFYSFITHSKVDFSLYSATFPPPSQCHYTFSSTSLP